MNMDSADDRQNCKRLGDSYDAGKKGSTIHFRAERHWRRSNHQAAVAVCALVERGAVVQWKPDNATGGFRIEEV